MKKIFTYCAFALFVGLSACDEIDTSVLENHQGAYILNQGTTNSSISYYNYERTSCTNDYYQQNNNGSTVGNGATRMAIRKNVEYPLGLGFVVLPESNLIEKINLDKFVDAGAIESFTHPTDVLITGDDVMYISTADPANGGKVTAYDYTKGEIKKELVVADNPVKLISSGKYLYVACTGDGTGAKVTVIDMSINEQVETVDLPMTKPVDMAVDIDRNVWVYCSDTDQGLVKVKRTLLSDEPYIKHEAIEFLLGNNEGESANPLEVSEDGRVLYYVYGHLCSNSVYIEEKDIDVDENDGALDPSKGDTIKGELSKEPIISGDYQNEAFNSIDLDKRTNALMALTSDGKLVVLKYKSNVWNAQEVYNVGEKPVITVFNY